MFTGSGCQVLQTAHIVAAQGRGGFDFHSYDSARAVLQNHIHILPGCGAPVEELRLSRARCGLLPQLHEDEILQNAADQISLRFQAINGRTQQVGKQSSVVQVNLRSLNDSFAEVSRPGT